MLLERSRRRGGPDNSTHKYKGVRQRTWGKWVAEIRDPSNGRRVWLGSFTSADDAARTYNRAAIKLYGSTAELNFIEPPQENCRQGCSSVIGVSAPAVASTGADMAGSMLDSAADWYAYSRSDPSDTTSYSASSSSRAMSSGASMHSGSAAGWGASAPFRSAKTDSPLSSPGGVTSGLQQLPTTGSAQQALLESLDSTVLTSAEQHLLLQTRQQQLLQHQARLVQLKRRQSFELSRLEQQQQQQQEQQQQEQQQEQQQQQQQEHVEMQLLLLQRLQRAEQEQQQQQQQHPLSRKAAQLQGLYLDTACLAADDLAADEVAADMGFAFLGRSGTTPDSQTSCSPRGGCFASSSSTFSSERRQDLRLTPHVGHSLSSSSHPSPSSGPNSLPASQPVLPPSTLVAITSMELLREDAARFHGLGSLLTHEVQQQQQWTNTTRNRVDERGLAAAGSSTCVEPPRRLPRSFQRRSWGAGEAEDGDLPLTLEETQQARMGLASDLLLNDWTSLLPNVSEGQGAETPQSNSLGAAARASAAAAVSFSLPHPSQATSKAACARQTRDDSSASNCMVHARPGMPHAGDDDGTLVGGPGGHEDVVLDLTVQSLDLQALLEELLGDTKPL